MIYAEITPHNNLQFFGKLIDKEKKLKHFKKIEHTGIGTLYAIESREVCLELLSEMDFIPLTEVMFYWTKWEGNMV